jgi:hypothetical protein
VLLKVLRSLRLEASTADDRLLNAVAVILDNAARRPRYLEPDEIDLAFASDRWKKLVLEQVEREIRVDRRQLEVCAFSYLMAELRSGDITVWGTESFADYRDQLLPMEQCRRLFRSYCEGLELPKTASEFVAHLKGIFTETAQRVDSRGIRPLWPRSRVCSGDRSDLRRLDVLPLCGNRRQVCRVAIDRRDAGLCACAS